MVIQQQVKAQYDFDAQPGSGELTIKEGELLTIIREGVDGGWIEGRNAKGKVGLFPESYVTRVSPTSSLPPTISAPMAGAPPSSAKPVASAFTQPPLPAVIGSAGFPDPWADPPAAAAPPPASHAAPSAPSNSVPASVYPNLPPNASNNHLDDDFDDEWTEDDEENGDGRSGSAHERHELGARGSDAAAPTNGRQRSHSRGTSGSRTDLSITEEDNSLLLEKTEKDKSAESISPRSDEKASSGKDGNQRSAVSRSRSAGPDTASLSSRQAGGGTTRMRNINRFSNFVKTGMESFILSTSKTTTTPTEFYEIIISDNAVRWAPATRHYTCTVDKPKKESKLKGLKSFIAYSLNSSLSGLQVSRRYKHFDWLHEQFSNKFLLIPSPPLPEKQVAGRYEEDLIEHRKCILQLWVNKICRHPVLGQSEVWQHFMNCADEKKWKAGKRVAEKDEFVGGNFFHCVRVPPKPVDIAKMDQQIETFSRCVRGMDESIKVLYERINESQKRLIGPYKSNWQKTAAAFATMAQSFEIDQSSGSRVPAAIHESANVLHKIGAQHEEHGKKDLELLMNWLYTYKGLLSNVPEMLNVHKSAVSKLKDNERLQHEGKLSPQEADTIRQRVDVISYATLAEITQLNEERDDDFKQMLGTYFEQQAQFYANIGQQFAQLAQRFKNA